MLGDICGAHKTSEIGSIPLTAYESLFACHITTGVRD